jgi:hypothetical protein
VSFCCPHCRAILSVSIDPIAIKTDIVKELLKKLRDRDLLPGIGPLRR